MFTVDTLSFGLGILFMFISNILGGVVELITVNAQKKRYELKKLMESEKNGTEKSN